MWRTTTTVIAALAVVVIIAAACGGSGDEGGDQAGRRIVRAEETSTPRSTAAPTSTPGPPPTRKPTLTPGPTTQPNAQITLLNLQCFSRAGYGAAEGVIKNTGRSTLNFPRPSSVFRNDSTVVGSGTGWLNVNSLLPGQESGFLTQSLGPIGAFTGCTIQFEAIVGGSCQSADDIARGRCGALRNVRVIDGR